MYEDSGYAEKANDLNTLNVYAVFAAYAVSEPNVIVVRESGTGVPRPLSTKPLTDTVQHIAIVRNSLCEAVHYINMSYGLSLVLLVKSLLIEVIFDLYLAIFERNNPIPRGSPIVYFEFMQFVWFSLHFVSLFILVDSSNRTTEEGNKTESIIKRMLLESPLRGPLASRLELFSRQLMLQRVGYRPLGLFSLNRTLVVSILGIIMTYLVILLQFENN
ncbi:putative gustatory receptor 28a [Plodia interpunctella]|uniref:putative gustatory receptor 28a n=1 Tax=Plodia interpunctella TaxID=58824 RepID=UPI00236798A9|nr:putative gustatory receptor 28a [Plodia interpunctella]